MTLLTRINPETLETTGKLDVSEFVGIVNHTSHPFIMSDGTVSFKLF